MSTVWKTKYGLRRVRQDSPTLAEAIFAAKGLSDSPKEQAEIAASLMGLPVEQVAVEVMKLGTQRNVSSVTFATRGRVQRSVVVERKPIRRPLDRKFLGSR
ncbi:MAG: hypothetical protein ABSG76_18370 [Xanthobacteraceae bacterium]|jgi:hypothetical protein